MDPSYAQNPQYVGKAHASHSKSTALFKSWLEAGERYKLLTPGGELPECP
jgi:hypothetical protein